MNSNLILSENRTDLNGFSMSFSAFCAIREKALPYNLLIAFDQANRNLIHRLFGIQFFKLKTKINYQN